MDLFTLVYGARKTTIRLASTSLISAGLLRLCTAYRNTSRDKVGGFLFCGIAELQSRTGDRVDQVNQVNQVTRQCFGFAMHSGVAATSL